MQKKLVEKLQWFQSLWSESDDPRTRDYRRHVRGIFIGWGLTALAMGLMELFPNEAKLSMYDMLRTPALPWQQHWLAAIELAAPLLMGWHANGLRRWGNRRLAQP